MLALFNVLAFKKKKKLNLCVCVCVCIYIYIYKSEVTQLCPTLSDLMDCSPPGSSVHGIFQTKTPTKKEVCHLDDFSDYTTLKDYISV